MGTRTGCRPPICCPLGFAYVSFGDESSLAEGAPAAAKKCVDFGPIHTALQYMWCRGLQDRGPAAFGAGSILRGHRKTA